LTTVQNTTKGRAKRISRVVLKTILWIVAAPIALVVVLFIALQFSAMQKYLTEKATSFISKKIKTKVELKEINISFPKSISLTDLYVEDEKSDTLFYGHSIKVDLNIWDLMSRKLVLNSIDLETVTGHIYRNDAGGKFNFSFIPDAFASQEKDTVSKADNPSKPFVFAIKNISLNNIYFTYHDRFSGLNADLHLGSFETRFDKFDLANKIIHVSDIELSKTNVVVVQKKPLQSQQDTSASKPFDFDIALEKINLSQIKANYNDQANGQDLTLTLGNLLVELKKIDLKKENIDIETIMLRNTSLYYTQNKTRPKDTLKVPTKDQSKGNSNWTVTLDKLALDHANIGYDNYNSAPIKNAIDFNHLLAKNISMQGTNLYADAKKIDFKLKDLSFTEQSGLALKKFKADISYDSTHAELKNLDLQINNSKITEHLALSYPSLNALKDSINELQISAEFKNTSIALKDVLYFSPNLLEKLPIKPENKNAVVKLSGKINGKINNLTFSKLEVKTKESTFVKLDGSLKNVTNPKNIYASTSFEVVSSKKDIQAFLVDSLIPKTITIPEKLSLKGFYKGYMKNFDADIVLKTSFGNISAGVTMNPKAGNEEQPYSGKLDVNAFDFGKLLNQTQTFGPVTLTATAKGSGFDTSNLNAEVHLGIVKALLKNYEYKNFNFDGTIQKKYFDGIGSMTDENLTFDFKGGLNLEPAHPKYTFTLNLTGADLKALNLSETDLRVSALIQCDIGNAAGSNAAGRASIQNALIIRNNRKYPIDSIVLTSEFKDGVSDLKLRSEIMTADFNGNIILTELPELLTQNINSYFDMQQGASLQKFSKQKFTFEVNIKDPYIITSNFVPQLEKLTPFSIMGSYDSEAKDIEVKANIEQVKYSGITVDSLKLNISSNKQKLNYGLRIAELSNPTFKFENLYLGGELKNNTLSFSFNTAKDDSVKLLAVSGLLNSMNHEFDLKLDPQLILNTENWSVDRSNYVRFGKAGLYANNLVISNGSQAVSLNSKEKTAASPLDITFKNFDITTLSKLLENKKDLVKGLVNGNVVLEKKNGGAAFKSNLEIRDFVFQAVRVGTIKLKASNYEDPLKYDVDLSIQGNGNDLAIKGYYKASETNDLDMLLDIRHLNLASVEPFAFKEVTRMSGSLNGKLNLKGPASLPRIDGSLSFKDAGFKPRILDSYLTISDSKITFASQKIRFDNFILRDSLDHAASLNGTIGIKDFKTIDLDLRLNTTDFLALNTDRYDNPLYYGKIIIDSDIRITGTTEAPTLDVKAKLKKGTTITYVKPESKVSKNESKGVVDFVNPNDKNIGIMARRNDSIAGISKMKGIELNASINFDKAVELKMIVDRTTGDSLYIQGGGLLDFGMDRSGKTSLAGKYSISDGGYFLSLESLIKRNFKILPGSSVTWSGDVVDPYIDLTAIYSIKTSPLDLVQNELAGVTEFEKNKYRNMLTFLVYLKMRGFVSTPEISFDIQLSPGDRGAMNGSINTRLAQLREDETQLNKQVFALLTLRRFIGENPLESSSEGGLSSASRASASKVLTQQLSSLSQKYVNFVDLDLGVNSFEDYSGGQQQGRTQLQLGVSKQLFNEKITVRVGGNVDLEGEKASQNTANNVAGNVNIDYKLTDDGRYKLEASRENQYENPIEGELTKTAAGVVYTRNFNTFKQLFSKPKSEKEKTAIKRAKAKQKKEKENQEEKEETLP